MRKVILFIIFVLTLSFPAPTLCRGEVSPAEKTGGQLSTFNCLYGETLTLTLEKAKELALANNRDILNARQGVKTAEGKITEAWSSYLPKLNLSGNYTYITPVPEISMDFDMTLPFPPFSQHISKTIPSGVNDNTTYRLSLTQLIFDWGRTIDNGSVAANGLDMAGLDAEYVRSQVIFGVTQAFYGAMLAEKILYLNRESLRIGEERLKRVEENFKEGASSSFELLKMKVQVSGLRPAVSRARNNAETAKNNLKNILGIPLDSAVELKGSIDEEPYYFEDYAASLKKAGNNRPEIKKIGQQERTAEKLVQAAKSSDKPVIMASASYQCQYPYYSDLNWVASWNVGASVNVPVFDGFYAASKVKQAKAGLEQVRLGKKSVYSAMELEVRQALSNLQEASERARSQKDTLDQAAEYLKIAESSYKSGVITSTDVMDAQLALLGARTGYTQALYDCIIAKNAYLKAVGDLK